ncbi:hypothetical protein [Magnetospirillum sp. LM-5]|nr:hypothetical protein [Magnetospirillum sp. LM-5]
MGSTTTKRRLGITLTVIATVAAAAGLYGAALIRFGQMMAAGG